LLVGGSAVVVVVLLVILSTRGDGATNDAGPGREVPATAPARSTPPAVSIGRARSGKPPAKPPPELTVDTLREFQTVLDEAKELINEGKKARTGRGENKVARAAMARVTKLLRQWEQKIAGPLRWQEDAEMEDWAQPAEYVRLEQMFVKFAKYKKEARMGGG